MFDIEKLATVLTAEELQQLVILKGVVELLRDNAEQDALDFADPILKEIEAMFKEVFQIMRVGAKQGNQEGVAVLGVSLSYLVAKMMMDMKVLSEELNKGA